MVLMPDGSEITHNLYEKRKAEAPKEQVTLSVFPNFEDEFIPKLKEKTEELSLDLPSEDESMAEITIRDSIRSPKHLTVPKLHDLRQSHAIPQNCQPLQ